MNLLQRIQAAVSTALAGLVEDTEPYLQMVKQAQDARFGDYQINCAMSLAKVLGKPPRVIAQEIVGRLDVGDWLEPPEIAGPGFINLRLRREFLASALQALTQDDRLGVGLPAQPSTIVIDFSSPNVAKPMHVGHLRSTIIGDALARLFRFLGHQVITDNHLGDWGTQFGILLYGYKNLLDEAAYQQNPVAELARLYVEVRKRFNKEEAEEGVPVDDPVQDACREETARLHAGDEENLRLWQQFMPACYEEIDQIYRRLDVRFDHTFGESHYQPMLAEVVQELLDQGIAQESQGAVVIFFGEEEPPALIRKRDGAFTYTTTDLATIRYRVREWNPAMILYVVDFRQALHFRNLFSVARRWGFAEVDLEHVSFGSVLGEDSRPIKTREGAAISLSDLLDESIGRAGEAYERSLAERMQKGEDVPDLTPEERRALVEAVGIGAVKYADLSQNRTSDYVFSWDKMLAMNGNTATYMQYAYARTRNIFRKGDVDPEWLRRQNPPLILDTPDAHALALEVLRLEEALAVAAEQLRPSDITSYLFSLASTFMTFYQKDKVLKAESDELRNSRLMLCDLTSRTIKLGLELLGIRVLERM